MPTEKNNDRHLPMRNVEYSAEIALRWRDLDDFGHVNNSVYFTYFEQARVQWWLAQGFSMKPQAEGPVVVQAECDYLHAIYFPETLLIHMQSSPPGRSSYRIFYQAVSLTQPDKIYASASTQMVWVDYTAAKSVPLPAWLRNYLEKTHGLSD